MTGWKVLYLQSRCEFQVEKQFSTLGIEYYLPKLKVLRNWSDRSKVLFVPAFPSYIFVKTDMKDRNLVFQAKGVLRYVRLANQDATLDDNELNEIRQAEYTLTSFSKPPHFFENGRNVIIVKSCLTGYTGVILMNKGTKAVIMRLNEILQGLRIEIPSDYLQSLDKT